MRGEKVFNFTFSWRWSGSNDFRDPWKKKKKKNKIKILLQFFVIVKNVPLGLKDITVVGVAVEGDGKLIEADFWTLASFDLTNLGLTLLVPFFADDVDLVGVLSGFGASFSVSLCDSEADLVRPRRGELSNWLALPVSCNALNSRLNFGVSGTAADDDLPRDDVLLEGGDFFSSGLLASRLSTLNSPGSRLSSSGHTVVASLSLSSLSFSGGLK